MNKNTLTGLLLMGMVMMLFMYLNKPTQDGIAQNQEQIEQQVAESTEQVVDTLTIKEQSNLLAAIKGNGSFDQASNSHVLKNKNVTLTLSADSTIGGTVMVNDQLIAVSDILTNVQSLDKNIAAEAIKLVRNTINNTNKYKGFAQHLEGEETIVTLSNDVLKVDISSKGGMMTEAQLLDPKYTKYDGGQVSPIATGNDSYGFILLSNNQVYDTRDFYFTPELAADSSSVLMTVMGGDGAMLGIRYTLPETGYVVKMELVQENMSSLKVSKMKFHWNQTMARNEASRVFESDNSAIYYMLGNGEVDNLDERSDDAKKLNEPVKWVGYKNQFFSTVMIPEQDFMKANVKSTVLDDEKSLKQMELLANIDYSQEVNNPATFDVFVGPNYYPLLSDLSENIAEGKDLQLTRLIPFGWALFRWINTWIVIPVFDFLSNYIVNYGIIILLLTIFIKLILFPFTYKSYMSQAKMRVLAPEIKEINDKYPGQENAMRRQQETMALYSRAGASPLSGCLPMLLQMPILIALFNFFPSAIELRGEPFLWAHDLSAPDAIISLPFAIPLLGDKLSLFCLLMTVVNILYTRINMQNQPSNASMPAMKWMMYLMPVMFLVFFNNYASGLSYYYFVSLLITIVQTYIFRLVVNEDKVRATMKANAAKPKKKSGFMARLEEAQRRQQAMLREQEKQRGKKGNR